MAERAEDSRLVMTMCGGNSLVMTDGKGQVIWRRAGHHYESLDVGELTDRCRGREGSAFVRRVIDQDLISVRSHYRTMGYLDARVDLEAPTISGDRAGVELLVIVKEGELYRVESVEIRGGEAFPADPWILDGLVQVKAGAPCREAEVQATRLALGCLYRKYGYPSARVTCDWEHDSDSHRSRFKLTIDEGPRKERPARTDGLEVDSTSFLYRNSYRVRIPGPYPFLIGPQAPCWFGPGTAVAESIEVVRQWKRGDLEALSALATAEDSDPWLVVEKLCSKGEFDAALAFAEAGSSPDTLKLPEYIAGARDVGDRPGLRERLKAARRSLAIGVAGPGSSGKRGARTGESLTADDPAPGTT
jgi:hypothetical protein